MPHLATSGLCTSGDERETQVSRAQVIRRRKEGQELRRLTAWAAAYVAAGAAGLVVGYAGHRPVGYGIAVLFGLLAVAQPLNERSFTRFLERADATLKDGHRPG